MFRNDQETIVGYIVSMRAEKPGSVIHDELPTDQSERRWDRWAWLTLAVGLALALLPLALALVGTRYPGDGWDSASSDGFGVTGPYRMIENLTGQPSQLQPEDRVVAINGRPLTLDSLPPLPPDPQVGQTLRYTIERDDRTLDVEVPIVQLDSAAIIRSRTNDLRDNPGSVINSFLLFSLAVAVFVLRPGSLAARYLFLFAMYGAGITFTTYSGIFLGVNPPWLAFLGQTYGWGWVYVFMPAITLLVLVFPVRKWPVRRFPRLTPFLLMGLPLLISVAANAAAWFGGYLPAAQLLLPLTIYTIGLMLLIVPATLIHNLLTIRAPLPRAQMRWIALGFGVGFVAPTTLLMLNFTFFGGVDLVTRLGNVALVFLPLCLAIGILRYRLFDIDVIIRRTTSYAIITALLALVYFGSIVVLQQLLSPFISDATPAVVLSTLLIAALFLPVRRRVQDLIDRRFNRTRSL